MRNSYQNVNKKNRLTLYLRFHQRLLRQALRKPFVLSPSTRFGSIFLLSKPLKIWKILRFLKISGVREKKYWFKTGYLQNSREAVPSRAKKNKVLFWYKIFLLKHCYEYKENFTRRLSTKMFIKKAEQERPSLPNAFKF